MSNSVKPIARKEGLVIQELNDEVLVYDLETNKAHCLNESAATIWKNCDGSQTIGEIAGKFSNKVDENFVWLAIDQLNELNLLEQELKPNFKGQSRREVLRKMGLATVISLPVIASLVAPSSVLAVVSCGCMTNSDCGTVNNCSPGTCNGVGQCISGVGPTNYEIEIQIKRPKNAR